MKIGELLVNEEIIALSQLSKALDIQRENPGKKIGEILIELGFIDKDTFEKVLARQLKGKIS